MTPNESFEKWWGTRLATLPWENDKMSAAEAFGAGWGAHETFINAGISQLAERGTCSAQDAGSTPAAGSITAEDIYKAYPRHVGKAGALKAIRNANRARGRVGAPFEYLLEQTRAYAAAVAQWPEEDRKYVPHPATWFNRGSYDDDPAEWMRGKPVQTSQFSVHH